MSEYQYYEFRAVDRALSESEMTKLAELRHDELSKHGFCVEYNYGDFPRRPREILLQYFDAFVYEASWAHRRFMLRMPHRLFGAGSAGEYAAGECLAIEEKGDCVILSFQWQEEGFAEEDGPRWMPELLPVRAALIAGDRRALYLGWLLGVQSLEVGGDALEPEVPPGLGDLDGAHSALVEFLAIDIDLVAAAAENSRPADPSAVGRDVANWVSGLEPEEREDLLVRLIADDSALLAQEMRQRALRARAPAPSSTARRTVAELLARGEALRPERMARQREENRRRRRAEEEERARRRREHLESLRSREDELWRELETLVESTSSKRYIYAAEMLDDLRDLAELDGSGDQFAARLREFLARHSDKPGLLRRVGEEELPA